MASDLRKLIDEHMGMPFPESVDKGLMYGEVDAVMIGADIVGWAARIESRETLNSIERTQDLLQIAADLQERGINLVATEQSIDTTTPEGKLFSTVIAAFAEFEHSMMRARTMDELAAARARGRKGGRKAKLSPQKIEDIRRRAAEGEQISALAEYFGVSRPTIYRALETV